MRAGSYPRREELEGWAGAGRERGGDAAVAGVQEHQAREDDAHVCDASLRLDAGCNTGWGGVNRSHGIDDATTHASVTDDAMRQKEAFGYIINRLPSSTNERYHQTSPLYLVKGQCP